MKNLLTVIAVFILLVSLVFYPLQTIEIVIWMVLFFFVFMYLIAFPILSSKNILFGRYEKDRVKITIRGDDFLNVFHRVESKKFNIQTEELEDGEQKYSRLQNLLKNFFRVFWIGNIFTDRVKYTLIHKEIINKKAKEDEPENWILDTGTEESDNLRWRTQRPLLAFEVEFKDGKSSGNFLINLELELVAPLVPTFTLGGDFYKLILQKCEDEFNERLAQFQNFSECISAKKEHSNFQGLIDHNSNFNQNLKVSTGFVLRDFSFVKRQIIDALAEAMVAQEKARLQGEAELMTADYKKLSRMKEADGETYYITNTEKAKVKSVVDQVKENFPNASEEDQMRQVFDLLGKKALADNKNLQVLVTDLLRK